MNRYRDELPQLSGRPFLTDGGMETTIIFKDGVDLPEFAAFPLLETEDGVDLFKKYYRRYAQIAAETGAGFVFESPTWRANPKWGEKVGYDKSGLERINRKAIELMEILRNEFDSQISHGVISGNIGPHDDGYNPGEILSAEQAESYHEEQIAVFADTAADLVTGLTITYADEGKGIVRAAQKHGIPSVISFTVETDGKLPSGQTIGEAIQEIDRDTDGGPAYYMVNCAHPSHFDFAIAEGGEWRNRIYGTRVNASKMSHEELDNAEELDEGNPEELARDHEKLFQNLPNLCVVGGCCGTDDRHVAEAGRSFVKSKAVGSNG